MKITGTLMCSWGLQFMALAMAFTLAVIYDGIFIQLFFGIAGALLGVQAYTTIKGEPRRPRSRKPISRP